MNHVLAGVIASAVAALAIIVVVAAVAAVGALAQYPLVGGAVIAVAAIGVTAALIDWATEKPKEESQDGPDEEPPV